jgi:hypothetical protein
VLLAPPTLRVEDSPARAPAFGPMSEIGSIASVSRCLRYVRSCPESGGIADIGGRLKGANNGRERVQQWMHQKAGYWITSSARASLAAAPAIAVEIAAARKSAVRRQSGPRGKRRLTVLRHWRSPKETGYAALRTANMGSAPSMPFGNVPGMNNRLLSAVA